MHFLAWYDDNPKKTTEAKIAGAVEAFEQRYGVKPNVVLVNEAEAVEVPGLTVKPERRINRNNYHVGFAE